MFRKLLCGLFVMTVGVGLVAADEFTATITKVDGNKVTYQKMKGFGKKAEKDGDPVTLEVSKNAKIAKAKFSFDKEAKKAKFEAGDAIEGGLKADVFAKIGEKGVNARITTSDDNKSITQILV